MAVNSKQFEEKQWRKPLRYLKEDVYVALGKGLHSAGFLKGYPNQPVFIIGSPRSGTSIFNKMIAECEDVANFSEAIYIWSPGDKDPECDHVKGASDATDEEARRIKGAFGFYQFSRRKRIFVNKCPRSSVRLPFIEAIFPEAKYIHVYRDGRAVVSSILDLIEREPFRQSIPLGAFCKPADWRELVKMEPLVRHACQWRDIMQTIREDSGAIDKKQWLDVSYEEFCRKPGETMSSVFEFMGARPGKEQIRNIENMPQKNDQKWRQRFSDEEIASMNEIMGQQLRAYNYDL